MNILVLSHRVPFPPNKGEKIRTFHQIKHLSENGHTVSVAYPYDNEQDRDYAAQLKGKFCQLVVHHALGSKFFRLMRGIFGIQALSVANFYSQKLQDKIDFLFVEEQFDTILCTASSMAEYIFKSKALSSTVNKPTLIMDFMDVDSDKWGQYAQSSSIPMRWIYSREQKLLAKYEKLIVERFDASFLIAQAEVELFNKTVFKTDKLHVLGNGIDTKSFYPSSVKPANLPPVFLFTGVMDYKPNIDAVVWFVEHCWSSTVARYPDALNI